MTNAERAATGGEPEHPPTSLVQGMDGLADLRYVHLPEKIDESLVGDLQNTKAARATP